jgi:hypothetical protein
MYTIVPVYGLSVGTLAREDVEQRVNIALTRHIGL